MRKPQTGLRVAGALALWLVLGSGCSSLLGIGSPSESELRQADTHRDRGALKLAEGEVELAIREYQNALRIHPDEPESHFGLGVAFRVKGLLDAAEAEFREALRLDPDHHDARLNLSALHLARGAWEPAIEESNRLLDDPTFLNPARALVNRSWAYFSTGELEPAEKDLREALAGDSSLYQAHLNLGIVLYAQDEIAESLQCFERVLELVGRAGVPLPSVEAEARFRIAQARVKLGQREEAVAQLRIASDRGGRGAWGTKAREYLGVLE